MKNTTIYPWTKWTDDDKDNAHDALAVENERLREALKGLANEINLSKLNVRKDFSLMNAHAYALKVLDGVK
jgi:hypothetical protein